MKYYKDKSYKKAKELFFQSLTLRKESNDFYNCITPLNNIGSSFKHLGQCDSSLIYLNEGIQYAEKINKDFLQEIETLPDSIKSHPNFPNYLRNKTKAATLERLYFHKAGCLHRLGRLKEAEDIFERLKQVATEREDQRFLVEIEEELKR